MTAAVRDLHLTHSHRFITDVRTSCPELWENNPYLTPLSDKDPEAEVVECEFPLIDQSNRGPYHAIHGYTDFLSGHLQVPLRPLLFKGDIHVSPVEKSWYSQVREIAGEDIPFWIVAAGGKYDCTIKWWDAARYQAVIDHFRGRIQFVQVGALGHYHPPLRGVIDLRGRTSLRQLVRLVYHSDGVLCGVTCLMHLAAAIETKSGGPPHRACVVIAGGREPPHWEAYPHHQFIHTVGALPCCAHGGCWRSRTRPLHDGEEFDRPQNLCVDVAGDLPRCMDLISPGEVIRRIEMYVQGGAMGGTPNRVKRLRLAAITRSRRERGYDQVLTPYTARARLENFVREIPPYPGGFSGRGIVVCGGGIRYFPSLWVCLNMVRKLGCRLPIQVWHLGEQELDEGMKRLLAPLGVEFVDAEIIRKRHPARILNGWELKSFALVYSTFREMILLDSDNVPVANPDFLFETREYQETGAIFWPDVRFYKRAHAIWRITGVPFRPGPEFESGQMVVDKERCWRPLRLALWFNEHSDFYYRYILGDKETFALAFRKLKRPYSMPKKRVARLVGTMCQHDFLGARIFQHRNTDKWNLWLQNRKPRGFRYARECQRLVRQLRQQWDGGITNFYRETGLNGCSGTAGGESAPPKIAAIMFSSPEYSLVRQKTLRRLARTDWEQNVCIVPMNSRGWRKSPFHAARSILASSGAAETDYFLFLGQDLLFNRYLRHNLLSWQPLKERRHVIASVVNPGVRADACDIENHCYAAFAAGNHQSHAFLVCRTSFELLLKHWTVDDQQELRPLIARAAARLNEPVLYHSPSLVRSNSTSDPWLGEAALAPGYNRRWKRPASRSLAGVCAERSSRVATPVSPV